MITYIIVRGEDRGEQKRQMLGADKMRVDGNELRYGASLGGSKNL